MARPLRIEYGGAHYHVTSRGNERKAIFRDDTDREKFLELIGRAVVGISLNSASDFVPLRPPVSLIAAGASERSDAGVFFIA